MYDAGQKAVYDDDAQIVSECSTVIRDDTQAWVQIMFEVWCPPSESLIVEIWNNWEDAVE